jgi:hypothetical protein
MSEDGLGGDLIADLKHGFSSERSWKITPQLLDPR